MATPKTGKPEGRPPIQFDLAGMESLAALHCTQAEVAAFFGVALSTVELRLSQEPEFRAAWERGQAIGKVSLRRQQAQAAANGNITMMIWLGKQLLGQKDRTEVTGADNKPLLDLSQLRRELADCGSLESARKLMESDGD